MRNMLSPIGDQFNGLFNWSSKMLDDCFHWTVLYNPAQKVKTWFRDVGKTNAYTENNEYVLKVDVPGVMEDQISLTMSKTGILTLTVTATETTEDNARNYELKEHYSQSFTRSFAPPANTDFKSEPVASLKDGVLTIRCKLTAPPLPEEPIKIPITLEE